MWKTIWTRKDDLFGSVCLAFVTACGPHPDLLVLKGEVAQLRKTADELTESVQTLSQQTNSGLSLALCSPEVKQLLEDVRKECTVDLGNGEQPVCTNAQIGPAVLAADPQHRGRFFKMMSHIPHAVPYIGRGATVIPKHRLVQIEQLAKPVALEKTLYLVVTSPASGEKEADRRAKIITQILRAYGVERRRINTWKYKFGVDKKEFIRETDHPGFGEPNEPERGVWIFRTDC